MKLWDTIKNLSSTNSRIPWVKPHRGIQQFGYKLLAGTVVLGTGATICVVHNNHQEYVRLMTINNAGAQSTFSKSSDVTLTLGKTRLSSDKKTAYVPVTFSSTASMSRNPNNYKIFIWTSNNKPIKYQATGQFVFYGSTGRAVLIIHSKQPIVSQPLFVYFRNDKHIPTVQEAEADSDMKNTGGNNSYGKYDVAMFKINPGVRSVTDAKRLNAQVTSRQGIEDVYESIFGSYDVDEINKQIKFDQRKIDQNISVANNLESALKDEGFDVPNKPAWMNDNWRPFDTVDINTGKTKTGKNAAQYDYDSSEDPDQPNFPSSLNGKDGETTDNANANQASQNSSSGKEQVGGAQDSPSDQWSQLQNAWTKVLQYKRDIYVTQYTQLAKIHKDETNVFSQTKVGSSEQVIVKSKVKLDK